MKKIAMRNFIDSLMYGIGFNKALIGKRKWYNPMRVFKGNYYYKHNNPIMKKEDLRHESKV